MTLDEAWARYQQKYPMFARLPPVQVAFRHGWYAREEAEFEELVRRARPEALAQVRGELDNRY